MTGKVLLLGCGSRRKRMIKVEGHTDWFDQDLVTLDIDPAHKPDCLWDLNIRPWPILDDVFDEVHAYEVLEHLGQQGDLPSFFGMFYEIWRILAPGGKLAATVPRWDSMWAWGDPGHRRVINEGSLVFLDQEEYKSQVGLTPMADYRAFWKGDFRMTWNSLSDHNLKFIIQAVKPARL